MIIKDGIGLDFDDVWLLPKPGRINSRSEVKINRTLKSLHGKYDWEGFPVIIANMDNVGTFDVAKAVNPHDMYVAVHKFYEPYDLSRFFIKNKNNFYTTGIRNEDVEKLERVNDIASLKYICIDAPNAYIPKFLHTCDKVRSICPDAFIMAGNCATPELVSKLINDHGMDAAKIFIGPGSHCLTRYKTGIYMPLFTATVECADAAHSHKGHICADGGLKEAGDFAKAFCAGADLTMAAGIFMGTEESGLKENWEFTPEGRKFRLKTYGMSSDYSQIKYYGKQEEHRASEGKVDWTPYKGPIANIIQDLKASLRSTGSYIGAESIKDFPKCATFIRTK